MKKLLSLLIVAFACVTALAQNYSYGIDEKLDEKAFAQFRKRMSSIRRSRPTVALVLSGGGAKGAAHIGVIKALEEEGIPVDLVLGTSIGGLVGGLYACGYNADELEAIFRSMDWDYMLGDTHPRKFDNMTKKELGRTYEFTVPFGSSATDFTGKERSNEVAIRSLLPDGVVYGQNVKNMLSSLLVGYEDERDFLTLPIPFVCIAADMVKATTKIWHSGRLTDAMRSTMSIPGLFTPVKKDGMVLIDGGMMDNYPAKIASRLGADIIIGVDISTPAYTAEEINTLLDIVYQALDVMGRESYNAGKEATSLYIHPDISGYGMMSFDTESIDALIERGKQAAKDSQEEIKAVKKKLRKAKVTPIEKKAFKITTHPIRISKVDFEGVSLHDRIYLRRKLNIGEIVSKADLDNAVYTLLGTNAFEMVTYDILGENEPYTILFNCKMAPVNQLGVSARFDNHDYASLIANAGFNARRLTGSMVDITGRLGLKSSLAAKYAYRTTAGFDFGASAMVKMAYNGFFNRDPYDIQVNFLQVNVDVFGAAVKWNTVALEGGARLEYFRRTSTLVDYDMVDSEQPIDITQSVHNLYPIVYLRLKSDTFDKYFFPTRGVKYSLEGNYFFPTLIDKVPQAFAVQGSFKAALSMGRFTMLPYLDFRYYSGSSFPYVNYLSVGFAGRTLDQQIPFVGISSAVACGGMLAAAGLDFRLRVASKHYITARAQYGRHAEADTFFTATGKNMVGVALEYAYDFLAGPVKVDLHWSNVTKSVGLYISLGYDF